MPRRGWLLAGSTAPCALALVVVHCSRAVPGAITAAPAGLTFPMYHFDRGRTGWSDAESTLVPSTVRKGLQRAWVSEPLDGATVTCPNDDAGPTSYPARLFAAPLYLDGVSLSGGDYIGARVSVVLAATTSGGVYAIAATDAPASDGAGVVRAGTVVWRHQVGKPICVGPLDSGTPLGVLSTPVLDTSTSPPTLYLAAVDSTDPAGTDGHWQVFAIDVTSGAVLPGWPVDIDPARVASLDVNSPVPAQSPPMATAGVESQRAALALSADGRTLFIGFGSYVDGAIGWMVTVDVPTRALVASFSGSAVVPPTDPNDPGNHASGGMWGAGGPAIASDGRVFMTTGNSPADSSGTPRVWGNSLLAWTPDLGLSATYTPFNYCLMDRGDTDLGGSSPAVFDVDPSRTSTPHLATFGGKQGVVYLVDRDHLAGSLLGRPACDADAGSGDSTTDTSLYGPQGLPQYAGRPGPLSVFGPYSDGPTANALDKAKMRTTPAVFAPASGDVYLYVAGTSRSNADAGVVVPPCLARLHVSLVAGQHAYLEPAFATNTTATFVNPGSPIVTSHDGGQEPVVWVLDPSSLRSSPVEPKPLRAPPFSPPAAVLYAFDGTTLDTLWTSAIGDLGPSGKYGHVVVAHGVVYVGTDRIAAFVPVP